MANHVLLARSEMASFVDSLEAPMSLLNAIIVAVGLRKKHETSKTYAMLERIWSEDDVYEKNEEIQMCIRDSRHPCNGGRPGGRCGN